MELRIALWSLLLLLLLGSIDVTAGEKELEAYKPLGQLMLCRDVQLPCIPMLKKDVPVYFSVFSAEGKLLAITKMLDGREEVVWGELKLPLKANEREL